jgi:SHS2 domain-containing protein
LTPGDGFRLIEHTADMGIEARAANCEAVVEAMARGLAALIFGRSTAVPRIRATIALRGADPVELLVSCLNEVVYWSAQGNLVPAALHVESLRNGELRATISGEPFDPGRHSIEREVKSVTYHQACLDQVPGGWYARVYVDI